MCISIHQEQLDIPRQQLLLITGRQVFNYVVHSFFLLEIWQFFPCAHKHKNAVWMTSLGLVWGKFLCAAPHRASFLHSCLNNVLEGNKQSVWRTEANALIVVTITALFQTVINNFIHDKVVKRGLLLTNSWDVVQPRQQKLIYRFSQA